MAIMSYMKINETDRRQLERSTPFSLSDPQRSKVRQLVNAGWPLDGAINYVVWAARTI